MAESMMTKKAISESLKQLVMEKSFEKISVKEISDRCGINRQTFYYHFEDKFNLLEWIYEHELLEEYMLDVNFDNWPTKLEMLLRAMERDRHFYIDTIKHTENYIQEFMISQAEDVFERAIDVLDTNKKVNTSQRGFIAKFFAYGVCGTIVEWAMNGMVVDASELTLNMQKLRDYCEQAIYTYVVENKPIEISSET